MEFGWIFFGNGRIMSGFGWIIHHFGRIFTQSGSIPKPDPYKKDESRASRFVLFTFVSSSPKAFFTQIQGCFIIPAETVFQIVAGINIPAIVFLYQLEGMSFSIFP